MESRGSMTALSADQPGLRERKKRRTRELIAETARRLFGERGFEGVTVAEVARAADVSEKTVFNYFPTKENLVYWRLETFEDELLEAVRGRDPGEAALAAFGRFVLARRGLLAEPDPDAVERLVALTRTILDSPALLAREQRIFDRYTASLAALLAEENRPRDGDIQPWVAANAMIGVHRALVDFSRRRIAEGVRNPRLAREVRAQGKRALSALESGLGDYAVKRR
jgi:AcrR family transcriptional regulator